jgi:hypothetical protein
MGGAIRKKLQVFISSTYEDMKDERQVAVQAVLEARHIPAGMELFAAGDESQLETIRRWIDESDVFLLLLGGRYGSIEPKSGKSYIEVEYNYALEQNKAYFALVLSEPAIDEKSEQVGPKIREQGRPDLLAAFRQKVLSKTCASVETPGDIRAEILKSLHEFETRDDLVGWVSGAVLRQLPTGADSLERSMLPEFDDARRVFERFRREYRQSKNRRNWWLAFYEIDMPHLELDQRAVYNAIDHLKAAGLVVETGNDQWKLTELGIRVCASGRPIDEYLEP